MDRIEDNKDTKGIISVPQVVQSHTTVGLNKERQTKYLNDTNSRARNIANLVEQSLCATKPWTRIEPSTWKERALMKISHVNHVNDIKCSECGNKRLDMMKIVTDGADGWTKSVIRMTAVSLFKDIVHGKIDSDRMYLLCHICFVSRYIANAYSLPGRFDVKYVSNTQINK